MGNSEVGHYTIGTGRVSYQVLGGTERDTHTIHIQCTVHAYMYIDKYIVITLSYIVWHDWHQLII